MSKNTWRRMAATSFIFRQIDLQHNRSMKSKNRVGAEKRTLALDIGSESLFGDFLFFEKCMSGSRYKLLLAKMFEDMDRYAFKDLPSVTDGIDTHLKSYLNDYDRLKKISLYDHTLAVAANVVKNEPKDRNLDRKIVLAIAHDFGKSRAIVKVYGRGNSPDHAYVSSNYMLEKGYELELGEQDLKLFKDLRYQHTQNRTANSAMRALCEADDEARRDEVFRLRTKEAKRRKKERS